MCSLKFWQMVFHTHAREKMGVLLAERLRDALRDVGFILPERSLAQLVLRYMRKDGMLRFGDFVSAILHLQRAFSKCKSPTLTSQFWNKNLYLFADRVTYNAHHLAPNRTGPLPQRALEI